jgi:hypothetical protein
MEKTQEGKNMNWYLIERIVNIFFVVAGAFCYTCIGLLISDPIGLAVEQGLGLSLFGCGILAQIITGAKLSSQKEDDLLAIPEKQHR